MDLAEESDGCTLELVHEAPEALELSRRRYALDALATEVASGRRARRAEPAPRSGMPARRPSLLA